MNTKVVIKYVILRFMVRFLLDLLRAPLYNYFTKEAFIMDKIKTSELISKLALASEEAYKCEDINFEFAFHGAIKKI